MEKQKKSIFETPLLSTKVKSANAKIFPEGGLGYFIGPTLALLSNSILAGYLNMYMTNVLNLTVWANTFFTLLPVISVIFVVIGNILVGRLMDRSRTKAGKARPLLLLSIPLSVLALLLLFTFAPGVGDDIATNSTTQIWTLVLLAIGYNLWFAVAYPCYYTPHAALVNLSTRNSKDRSLLATISNATALAAMGLCSMVLPFFLGFLFVEDGNGVTNAVASQNAWRIFAIALMVITALGVLVEYFFTRERITEESFANNLLNNQKKAEPISKQAKVCFKDKFWWIIIVFFFLYQLGGMLKNVSQLYFCQANFMGELADGSMGYSTTIGGQFHGTLSIIGAVPTAIGMVIAWPLSNKIGKGKAILFGAILSVAGGAIGFIDPTNFYLVVASFVIKALGSTPAMYLSLALLADILDHQEAVHGFRTDGFTMTIYGAIMAGMTGIATGIMNGILGLVGYSAENVSSPAIQSAMTWIFIGGETICYALIVIIFIFMGVEKFTKVDKKAIELNQRAQAEADGVEYVDPATKLAQEEEEAELNAQQAKRDELKKKCEKKGLNYEEELKKLEEAEALKKKQADDKKAAADAKKEAAEKQKQAKFDELSPEEKAKIEAKNKAKEEKLEKKDANILAEFNKIREKYGKPAIE